MKLAIVGSRTFDDYETLVIALYAWVQTHGTPTAIVSGGARGADRLAARFARDIGVELIEFIPEWDKLGKRAGYVRNAQIVNEADAGIAFWDGVSRGTKHSINLFHQSKKPFSVIQI